MRSSSRPMSVDGRCWDRYAATESSRPLSVASPQPTTPSLVTILRVTKLRPGLQTLTSILSMVMDFFLCGSGVFALSHRGLRVGQVAAGPVLGPDGGDQRRE